MSLDRVITFLERVFGGESEIAPSAARWRRAVYRASGSLEDRGMPLLSGAKYLLGEFWSGTDPRSIAPFELYGAFPIAPFYNECFLPELDKYLIFTGSRHLDATFTPYGLRSRDALVRFARTVGLDFGEVGVDSLLVRSGSHANEAAIRLARRYVESDGGRPGPVLATSAAHSEIRNFLGGILREIPLSSANGYRLDEADLVRKLEEFPDCRILVLTAPTTSLNTIEGIGEAARRIIRERKIWVHLDTVLAPSMCILPTAEGSALRTLIGSGIASSAVLNVHKMKGLPECSLLLLPRAEHIDRLQALQSEYIGEFPRQIFGSTSGTEKEHLVAWNVLSQVGNDGMFFLTLSAFVAANVLASCLEKRGVKLFGSPRTPAVGVELRSRDEMRAVRAALRSGPAGMAMHTAAVCAFSDDGPWGIRIVMPYGIFWSPSQLDHIAAVVAGRIAMVRDGGTFVPGLGQIDPARILTEAPRAWVAAVYHRLSKRTLTLTELCSELRELQTEFAKRPIPEPTAPLKRRARLFGCEYAPPNPACLFALPEG